MKILHLRMRLRMTRDFDGRNLQKWYYCRKSSNLYYYFGTV